MFGTATLNTGTARGSSVAWEELLVRAMRRADAIVLHATCWCSSGRRRPQTTMRASGHPERSMAAFPTDAMSVDQAEIQAVLDGDPNAYAVLIKRQQDEIGAYMWRFTRDRNVWEELVQDVFVEAYFSLSTYRQQAPFSHWLKRIATRVGYRFWRRENQRRKQRDTTPADEPVVSQDAAMSAAEAADLVQYLLAQLSPPNRLVLTLHYLEQLSVAEIAAMTRWSETRVKVTMFRARQYLRKVCERLEIEL